jgi:hypothetical protein
VLSYQLLEVKLDVTSMRTVYSICDDNNLYTAETRTFDYCSLFQKPLFSHFAFTHYTCRHPQIPALEASLASDLDHARECRSHVRSTLNRLDTVYDRELVNDTIRLAREALALSQKEDEDHLDACFIVRLLTG